MVAVTLACTAPQLRNYIRWAVERAEARVVSASGGRSSQVL